MVTPLARGVHYRCAMSNLINSRTNLRAALGVLGIDPLSFDSSGGSTWVECRSAADAMRALELLQSARDEHGSGDLELVEPEHSDDVDHEWLAALDNIDD